MIKSLKKQQGGFTLIELMVVIVIIGILVAIALPNFIGAQDRAKVASVKANMHTYQTALETYAVDWGGQYPADEEGAKDDSNDNNGNYWKDFTNPIDQALSSYTSTANQNQNTDADGMVGYNNVNTTTYYIYGYDKDGNLIKDKGRIFTLGNS